MKVRKQLSETYNGMASFVLYLNGKLEKITTDDSHRDLYSNILLGKAEAERLFIELTKPLFSDIKRILSKSYHYLATENLIKFKWNGYRNTLEATYTFDVENNLRQDIRTSDVERVLRTYLKGKIEKKIKGSMIRLNIYSVELDDIDNVDFE